MRKNWHILSALVVFLFTITGLGYITYRNRNPVYNGEETRVLGVEIDNLDIKMSVEVDGRRIQYETQELSPGATLQDLIDLFNRESEVLIQVKTSDDRDYISSVKDYMIRGEGMWTVYINNVEYIGFFEERTLEDNSVVRIIWE